MQKNTAGKWVVFACQGPGGASPGDPVTGDAANITADIHIDGGAANPVDDVNPTELGGGYYIYDTTAAESNGDLLLINPVSSTANVKVVGMPETIWTTPAKVDANVIEWLGATAAGESGGYPSVNIHRFRGETVPTTNQSGVPIVDVGYWKGSVADDQATLQDVNDEVVSALVSIHLDHLFAVDYDPASKPGITTSFLNELVEDDSGVTRFTANALEEAPSGTGASAASIRAEMDANSTQLAAIVEDTNELQTNQGQWATATGFAVPGSPMTLAVLPSPPVDWLTNAAITVDAFTADKFAANWLESSGITDGAITSAKFAATGEPAQGNPPESATTAAKIDWLYKLLINKMTQDADFARYFNFAGGTVDHKAAVSEDGTTATREKIVTGP